MKKSSDTYLAYDLGASSGRAVAGVLEDGHLRIQDIHRFPNAPVEMGGRLFWDFPALWQHAVDAMRACADEGHCELAGIGIDTWGVDFGLLGHDGTLLGNPVCYRDGATEGIEEVLAKTVGAEWLYRTTGMTVSRVGTLPQLCAMRADDPARLRAAETLLLMPDLFRYFMCGHKAVELTSAGSTLLTNVRRRTWSPAVFAATHLPRRIMPGIVEPGTVVGRLHADLARAVGLNRAQVIAVAGHDTLSAAAAAPYVDERTGFLSCGTWSVLGVVQDEPRTCAEAMEKGFVSELGADCVLLVRNMMGLYLFENLHRALAATGHKQSYAQMVKAADAAKPFVSILDLAAPLFFSVDNPTDAIARFLAETGQHPIGAGGALMRLILEGVAWGHRSAVEDLVALEGRPLERLCLVGGGSRNALLCQMTADATGLEVIAGPAEATVIGNLGLQATATGRLRGTREIRDMVQRSFKLRKYKPRAKVAWDRHADRFREIRKRSARLK